MDFAPDTGKGDQPALERLPSTSQETAEHTRHRRANEPGRVSLRIIAPNDGERAVRHGTHGGANEYPAAGIGVRKQEWTRSGNG